MIKQLLKRWWPIPAGIIGLCLLLFVVPFFWKAPLEVLLKSRLVSGYGKGRLIGLYNPAPVEDIRQNVHLYNDGYKPKSFIPGPVYVPGKGMNYQDSLGLLLSSSFFEQAEPFENRRARVHIDFKYGLINTKGKWVLPTVFDTLYRFKKVYVVSQGTEAGVADKRGRMKTPLAQGTITPYYNGKNLPFLRFEYSKGSFSFIDSRGRIRKDYVYDSLIVRDGFVYVGKEGKWGVANIQGKELISPLYDEIIKVRGDLFAVRNDGLEGLHKPGAKEPLVPVIYEKAEVCTPSTYRVLLNDHYGLLDKKAAVLIEPVYDTIYIHHLPEWIVTGHMGFYALRNTKKLEYPSVFYYEIGPCKDGMTVVRNEHGYGVLSRRGKTITVPGYEMIRNYSSGVAVVYHHNQYAVMDRKGSFTLPFSLNLVELNDYYNSIARAARFNLMTPRIRKQYGFVDTKGNTVIPFLYEDGHLFFTNGLVAVKLGGKWGFINEKGETTIPFLYDTVSAFSNGKAYVLQDNTLMVIDTEGNVLE